VASAHWSWDHFQVFTDAGVKYSINSCRWIHPLTASILREGNTNCMTCMMLDTTWNIIHDYVTSILVAISRNIVIPLTFGFSSVEDFEIYNCFWTTFLDKFEINLSSFILLSDQGSGLRKFAQLHEFTQLHEFLQRICLRHYRGP
jgi:hypothetical protein